VLRPTFVYGPRDRAVLPRIVQLLREGRLVVAGRGDNPLHLIHAADVAQAAASAGRAASAGGRIYVLDGSKQIAQRDFLAAVAQAVGARPPARSLPLPLLWGLALAEEALYRVSPRTEGPGRTRYLVAFCGGEAYFDTSRAERELDFKPGVQIREGLASALSWWSGSGRSPRPAPPDQR
jgi:nucleoside-diphosphate-sugar epimerase